MSKNLTRKGLAFGAIVALGSTLLAGAPANAAGLADTSFVSLAPTTGTQYNTAQAQVLDLSSGFASSVATGGSLKFLVTDADKVIKADVDVNASTSADTNTMAYSGGAVTAISITSGVADLTVTTAAHTILVGDRITLSGFTGADAATVNTTVTVSEVSASHIKFNTSAVTVTLGAGAIAIFKTAETGNATRAEIAAAALGSRSILGTAASIGARATDGSFVVDTADTASTGVDNVLRLVSTAAADTSATATVTAWIDNNGNGAIDSTEYVSPTRTVQFLKNAEITWTTALAAPKVGDTTLSADVTATPDINISQFATNSVQVDFNKNAADLAGGTGQNINASYNSTDKVLRATTGAVTALTAGTFSAQAQYDSANRGDINYQTIGSASVDVSSVSTPSITRGTSWNGTYAKTGTTALSVSSTVKYWKTYASPSVEAAAGAGIPALVTITNTALVSGSSIVAGGKTLASTGTSISFATSTNADGKVVFPLTATGAKTDAISITVRLDDADTTSAPTVAPVSPAQGYKTSSALAVVWADAAATNLVETGTKGYATSVAVRSVAKGGTITLNYDLRDQFGASVAAERQIVLSLTGATANSGATYTNTVALAAGKAAVTITDATTATSGSYGVVATLQKKDTSGNWVADGTIAKTVTVYVGTKASASVTAVAGATTKAVTAGTFATNDLRIDNNAAGFADYALDNGTTISGVVSAADGSPVPGALVTITGAAAQLVAANAADANATATMGVGTVSVYTDATGAYSVSVYSRTSGDITYTATVGAATASAKVTYTGITTLDDKGTITITAATLSQVARTLTVSVLVKDSLGNPVKTTNLVKVALTGVGSLSASTVDTDANGVGTVRIVVGSNDLGDAVVTASYAQTDATKSVSTSSTITFGATDAQIDIVGNRVTSVTSFSKGKTVAFYVDGIKKWSKVSTSDADVLVYYNLKKGTHTIAIKISGGFVVTEKFVVKK